MSCACVLAVLLAGQTPPQPDFSGRWVLIAPHPAPEDVPAVLVVQQHLKATDIRGHPMQPLWDLLTVRGHDSKSGVRSGEHHIGMISGVVEGGAVGPETPRPLPPQHNRQESVNWEGNRLVVTSEAWMVREKGKRESYERHTEVWALTAQARLEITVTDSNAESRTRTVTYQKEQLSR